MAHFASNVKMDWTPDPNALMKHANEITKSALGKLRSEGIEDIPILSTEQDKHQQLRSLPLEISKLLLKDSISPLPLHKTLVLLDCIEKQRDKRYYHHELLALAKALVTSISNLRFGPEVGVGPTKSDSPVIATWLSNTCSIAEDLSTLPNYKDVKAVVHLGDSREIQELLEPNSIDAVITSPPYPNEKDYTRTTRLESVLLGFINSKEELRKLKRGLIRSNTRCVYKDDDDDKWVREHPEIQRIAKAIESRRIKLGKTSGFERLYSKVTKQYFGGMSRHLAELRPILRPGAKLAYVVGDQASYLRIMIRTGQLLADIAKSLGYELIGIDLFRTRLSTATKEHLREEVLVLRWPG